MDAGLHPTAAASFTVTGCKIGESPSGSAFVGNVYSEGAWLRHKSDAAEFVLVWQNVHEPSFLPVFRAIDAVVRNWPLILEEPSPCDTPARSARPSCPASAAKRATSQRRGGVRRTRRQHPHHAVARQRRPAACRSGETEAVGKRPHAEGEVSRRQRRRARPRCRRSRRSGNSSPTSSSSSWPAARRRSASASPKGFLVVDRGHRRADGGLGQGDDELRLARARHRAARIPARGAPRNSATRWA